MLRQRSRRGGVVVRQGRDGHLGAGRAELHNSVSCMGSIQKDKRAGRGSAFVTTMVVTLKTMQMLSRWPR